MTRPSQGSARTRRFVLLAAAACALARPALSDANLFAAEHERHVVADPRNGLALFGFDPVAYHFEKAALKGSPQHEVERDGRFWRFGSAANKAAFVADAAIYMPLFGGHDGAAAASGLMVDGNPEIFLLAGGRLVLFRDEAGRDRFAADADVRSQALRSWPEVVRRHAGH